ncbi:hypothetical protein CBOM_02492 [Ceraceosorus bombacis]|uniref:Uncharacterized protein n=1 Tax=Ceraceosorus bombacis TaxID=401625 RepID=A0A0N7L9T3_9BASI|nr:hypothetical protein CBOM_02492 [Ceraceosorus bombacis]
MCTRQFCLDQGLESCKGATLERPDKDTGTGWEGQVWARCFQRDSYKDQSIVTLYILTVTGLLLFATLRTRLPGWIEDYRAQGAAGVYRSLSGRH